MTCDEKMRQKAKTQFVTYAVINLARKERSFKNSETILTTKEVQYVIYII